LKQFFKTGKEKRREIIDLTEILVYNNMIP